MEYKILDVNNQDKSRSNLKTDSNKKFEKILKNLLDIKTRGENALSFKLNKSNFDLFNIFGEEEQNIKKIFQSKTFSIKIPVKKISQVKKVLDSIFTYDDLMDNLSFLELTKASIKAFQLDPHKDLFDQDVWEEDLKDYIIEKNKKEIDSFNSKWKRFQKEINDKYEETNIWPLYIGTYFLKFSVNRKEIYAPLILKEVHITSNNNNFYIESRSESALLNDKLIFFLSEFKNINVPPLFEDSEFSMEDLSKELDAFFNESELVNTHNFELKKLKAIEVKGIIDKQPGIVLSMCNPLGSALRKATLKLIEIDKLNKNLINSKNDMLELSDDVLTKQIVDKRAKIARICPTDLSQEKSILSGLQDSSIIIGPPGTGKSQTIANILANILLENKSALFISQKKVALDVVLERLKFLRFFTFQTIEDNVKSKKDQKAKFYYNLNQWIYFNFYSSNSLYYENNHKKERIVPSITDELKKYWQAKNLNVSKEERDVFYKLVNFFPNFNSSLFEFLKSFKNQFEIFSKDEILMFEEINGIFNSPITKNDFIKITQIQNNLSHLTMTEINSFLELSNEVKNVSKYFLTYINENRNKFQAYDWVYIGKFFLLIENTNLGMAEIFNLLNESKEMFSKLRNFNLLHQASRLLDLSHANKNVIAKEFGFKKKGIFPFRFYEKDFNEFWSVNSSFNKFTKKFKLNSFVLSFLISNENEINNWTNDFSFFSSLKEYDLSPWSWNMIKNNINSINIWNSTYEFLEIIKNYSLNEKIVVFILSHLELINKFVKNFEENNVFFNNISKLKINNEIFDILQIVSKDVDKYSALWEIYNDFHHNDFIPKTNEFIDNEYDIKNKLKSHIRAIYESLSKEEKDQFKRLKGRIESGKTIPHKLFSMFKDLFKKFFKIIVSTPEDLATKIDFINDHYDYVIFDEASQLFLEKAIPFLAISEKAIIAGDDQQMQPSNWFALRVDSDVSEDEEENDENVESLLTYAINSGIPKHLLELNYRSKYANLTSFSSKHFYESKLKSLDANIDKSKSIEVIQVEGYWDNSQNLVEAKKAIEILKENIDKYEKIILLTLNKQQMDLIDLILSVEESHIYNKMINDRTIILKNLENIQGDEADLVIVSVAYTRDTHLAGTYVCRPTGKNALNVAITRAKDKMIVVKSIRADEIRSLNPNILLFKEWLSFLDLHYNQQKTYSIDTSNDFDIYQKMESGFEKSVYDWLSKQEFNKKIKIESQFSVGSYKIDFALVEVGTEKFLLGIEVDGWGYHSTPRQIYNDTIRQQFIESKGYKLLRIPEMMWEIDREKILANIHRLI